MKTALLFIAAGMMLSGFWGNSLGQTHWEFGLKAGLSISRLNEDSEFLDFDSRLAPAAGAFVIVEGPGLVDIQTEVLYSPKGGTDKVHAMDESGNDLGEFTTTFQINYLEIPVLARISWGSKPLYVLAGPAFAFKLSDRITASDVPGYGDIDEDWEGIGKNDIGLVLGAGAALSTKIEVDARYTLGLSNVNNLSWVEYKNRSFLVMAGVRF